MAISFGFEGGEFFFQFADAFDQVGQAIRCGGNSQPQFIFDGGRAGLNGVRRRVARQSTFCGDDGAFADVEMAGAGGLSGEDDAAAGGR